MFSISRALQFFSEATAPQKQWLVPVVFPTPQALPATGSPMNLPPLEFVLAPDGEFLEAPFRETEGSRELQSVLDPKFL